VIVAGPPEIAVSNPLSLIETMFEFEELHVPPLTEEVSVLLDPTHKVVVPEMVPAEG
jgi:hypothetical protein